MTDPERRFPALSSRSRAHARPRDYVARTGSPAHVHAEPGAGHPHDRRAVVGFAPDGRLPGGMGARTSSTGRATFSHGRTQRIDLDVSVQLQQETMVVAVTAATCTGCDDVFDPAGAFRRRRVLSVQPARERSPRRSSPRGYARLRGAQDVGDHPRQLHVGVFQRLLQRLRVPRDLAVEQPPGPRSARDWFLNRGRRHEAARRGSDRRCRRDGDTAPSWRSEALLRLKYVAAVMRRWRAPTRERRRQSSRMSHTGFHVHDSRLHRHVACRWPG